MTRLTLLLGSLAAALALAVFSLQSPAPRDADAPADAFSAGRAMADVRQIARAPHPVGSEEHARVREYLLARMTALGLEPQVQSGPLSTAAVRRLERWGLDPAAAGHQAHNLVGVLPGRNPDAPAVMLMAHYDSVATSPGAADDAAGVAAILETVRALKARGVTPERSLVVLLTDAEELNLDGARVFFGGHPLRDRIGAVINLEARGGGGRAMMFETGRGDDETVRLFGRSAVRADGGVTSNSLAVFVYALMPNGTDFTVPRDRGIGGLNFAFIGRADQYHDRASTPEALDQGSLQHIGSQALETAQTWLTTPALPQAGTNRVYADLFGRVVLGHAPGTGWVLLGLAFALWGLALWAARRDAGLDWRSLARGAADGLWFLTAGLVLTGAVRLLAGPMGERAGSAELYYTLLRRLPWIEAGAALSVAALALFLLAGRDLAPRRAVAAAIAVLTVIAALGGGGHVIIGAGVIAVGLSLFVAPVPADRPVAVSARWLGLIGLVLVLGAAAQTAAPQAALIFVWPGLAAAFSAAVAALLVRRASSTVALAPVAVITAVAGGWLLTLAHPVFLGVGMDLPGVLALIGLLVLAVATGLSPGEGLRRGLAAGAAACLLLACGASLAARFAEPPPAPAPTSGSGVVT